MDARTRGGRGSTPRPPHLQLIRTSRSEGTPEVPPVRHTQCDAEAALKAGNVIRMILAGYISPAEAMPWIGLELGVRS